MNAVLASAAKRSYHFHDFHHGVNAEVIEECCQVLLHLDAVVVHLGHGEDAHLALPPNLRGTNGDTADKSNISTHSVTLRSISENGPPERITDSDQKGNAFINALTARALRSALTCQCVHLVLAQEEGQEHQHASVVDDPPDVDVTLGEALSIGREG